MNILQHTSKEDIIQNMKDAGCGRETIEGCMTCIEKGRKKELLEKLYDHRRNILDNIHNEEKQIGCLDYLVYQIGKY